MEVWVGIIGTLAGLTAGLIAPYVSSAAAARSARRGEQAELARTALSLFEGESTLERLLRGTASATRRKLFLIANQLDDEATRRTCLDLVAAAGDPSTDELIVEDKWTSCVQLLGQVARAR